MTPTQSLCSRHAELPASSFPCCICWEQRWALLESTTSNQAGCKAPRTSMPRRHSYSGDRGATAKTRSMRSQDTAHNIHAHHLHIRMRVTESRRENPLHRDHTTKPTKHRPRKFTCAQLPASPFHRNAKPASLFQDSLKSTSF